MRTVRAVRVTSRLEIDGRLEEAFYRETIPITEFMQTVPVERGEPSERTEAWIGFDDRYVYVSARMAGFSVATNRSWVDREGNT